jgi:hypothetical protein
MKGGKRGYIELLLELYPGILKRQPTVFLSSTLRNRQHFPEGKHVEAGSICTNESIFHDKKIIMRPPTLNNRTSCKNRKFDKTNKMTVSARDTSYADHYFGVLKNLNANSKIDLISQLSQSLKADKIDTTSLESLFGAYQSEETADEIIAELRSPRVSNRNIEPI